MRNEEDAFLRLYEVLESADPAEDDFSEILLALGELLECDRCFLYLRNPVTAMGKATHCWCRSSEFPRIVDPDWKLEPANLALVDPLFAAALHIKPTILVEDVETAATGVVNREFERRNFGHRALIHAHLCQGQQLWGILQPCVFGHPRVWSKDDQGAIACVVETITPLVVDYVKAIDP
jgi:GAF domain-containing protein